MSITKSELYRRHYDSFCQRAEEAWKAKDLAAAKEAVESFDGKIVAAVNSIVSALSNVRVAARHLRQIASRGVVAPPGVSYEALISYHNAAALNEFGAARNRTVRLLNYYSKELRGKGEIERALAVRDVRDKFVNVCAKFQDLRDVHDHEMPFSPTSFALVRYVQLRSADRAQEYRKQARRFALAWERLARLTESMAEFTMEIAELSLRTVRTREQLQVELTAIVEKTLRSVKSPRRT